MTPINFSLILLVTLISVVVACGQDNHNDNSPSQQRYFYHFNAHETINGVPPETRIKWMRFAMQTKLDLLGPCPFDSFGAVIVNRTSDTLVCATFDARSRNDPSDHAEMHVIRSCSDLYPGQAFNKALWAELSLYTTGESCPMCMSATRWAGIGESIYATSIEELHDYGWTQIMISSYTVDRKSLEGDITPPTIIIAGVIADEINPYFAYQFDPNGSCPQGCARVSGRCSPTTSQK